MPKLLHSIAFLSSALGGCIAANLFANWLIETVGISIAGIIIFGTIIFLMAILYFVVIPIINAPTKEELEWTKQKL